MKKFYKHYEMDIKVDKHTHTHIHIEEANMHGKIVG